MQKMHIRLLTISCFGDRIANMKQGGRPVEAALDAMCCSTWGNFTAAKKFISVQKETQQVLGTASEIIP